MYPTMLSLQWQIGREASAWSHLRTRKHLRGRGGEGSYYGQGGRSGIRVYAYVPKGAGVCEMCTVTSQHPTNGTEQKWI